MQPDDLASTFGVHRHGDYGGDRDDAPALTHLEVGGVEPEIGPCAGQRALEEGVHPLIDVLAQLRHGGLRDARQPHGLHQVVHAPSRHACDPRLLDHRHQRLLDGLPWLQEAGEVAAGAQLGDLEVERAQPRVEAAFAIPVAVGAALARTARNDPRRSDRPHRPPSGSAGPSRPGCAGSCRRQPSEKPRSVPLCRRSSVLPVRVEVRKLHLSRMARWPPQSPPKRSSNLHLVRGRYPWTCTSPTRRWQQNCSRRLLLSWTASTSFNRPRSPWTAPGKSSRSI